MHATGNGADIRGFTSMYRKLKKVAYTVAKYCGLFAVCSFVTRRQLRILCYHGISFADEHLWSPDLFITPESLRRRFDAIRAGRYPVLTLREAVIRLNEGTLPRHATVITIDDGFKNNHALGMPMLREFQFPATIYVSSYYVEKQTPVFNLAVKYLFWKAGVSRIDLSDVAPSLSDASWSDVNDYANANLTNAERLQLFRRVAAKLSVDAASIERQGLFHFMNMAELRELRQHGIDVELHTHRHPLLLDAARVGPEIADNREALEDALGERLQHFCYPSGVWSDALWPGLQEQGIVSATTCDKGLNASDAHPYALRRYLDCEANSQIEFEAELSGFAEILRRLTLAPAPRRLDSRRGLMSGVLSQKTS